MKIFVIGGVTVSMEEEKYSSQLTYLSESVQLLGQNLIKAGHDLIVCSPFEGSADLSVLQGALTVIENFKQVGVEIYYPNIISVCSQIERLGDGVQVKQFRKFPQSVSSGDVSESNLTYPWLLAQLVAMDHADMIICIGGKLNGAATLLLSLAAARKKPILPFTFLHGAASQLFQKREFELTDRLGQDVSLLHSELIADVAISLIDTIGQNQMAGEGAVQAPNKFFLSYANERPAEADFVEMILRRRNLDVFRDEVDFDAGRFLLDEIDEKIYGADIFIALWCKEYACSPWCFDEFDLALKRQASGKLKMWILKIDETRIVPPGARDLLVYNVASRGDIEGTVLKLLEASRGAVAR